MIVLAIKEKEVWITLHSKTIKYYEDLGYNIPKYKNANGEFVVKRGTKILVKIEDLQNRSNTIVTKICDVCKNEVCNQPYNRVLIHRIKIDGKDRCKECGTKIANINQKNNVKYEKSAEYYALKNNKEYLLKEFSDKNKKKLSEIYRSTSDVYLWNCPDCKSEYDMQMQNRVNDKNCPYCAGKRVNHTNCIATTHPFIAKLLTNPQRGYEVTAGSGKRESFTCTDCGNAEDKKINNVVNFGFSCSKCSDGISYPEKIMMSFLDQLNIEYRTQEAFDLSNNKKYDFYIESLNCIIETHGRQHYENTGFKTKGGRPLEEEQENDRLKERLAKENGIELYIVIDCRKSEMDFIKNNIINSKLNELFDLHKIDWLKCHEFASKSLIIHACKLWNSGIKNLDKIGLAIKVSSKTVREYLKNGVILGLCDYNARENRGFLKKSKQIVQLSADKKYIKTWNSMYEIEKTMNFTRDCIKRACKNRKDKYGSFWMYAEDYYKQLNNS